MFDLIGAAGIGAGVVVLFNRWKARRTLAIAAAMERHPARAYRCACGDVNLADEPFVHAWETCQPWRERL